MTTLEIFEKAKTTYLGKVSDKIIKEVKETAEQGATMMGLATAVAAFEEIFMNIYQKTLPKGERGFERISEFEDSDIPLPKRATKNSAGYDFHAIEDVVIEPHTTAVIKTGIKSYFMPNEVLMIVPRSSIGIKRNLMMPNNVAIIDSDYYNNSDNEGHIFIPLHNLGNEVRRIKAGERIAQGIFVPFLTGGDIPEAERVGGVGSTGKGEETCSHTTDIAIAM